jgi:hypothetical protein
MNERQIRPQFRNRVSKAQNHHGEGNQAEVGRH